jgi:hypothetical protein
MTKGEFYIAFTGTADRVAALSRFFDRLVAAKSSMSDRPPTADELDALVRNSAWIDSLDRESIERLTAEGAWPLEDILECVLKGEYTLTAVTFDGRAGRLVYDPWAYPFGGTDALKALVGTFGLEVARDSFHDGFEEGDKQNAHRRPNNE